LNNLGYLAQGTLVSSSVDANKKLSSHFDATYTITFQPAHPIIAGGGIIIEFPAGSYNLETTDPKPRLSYSDNVTPFDASGINVSFSSNIVTIDSIAAITAQSTVVITLAGINNPAGSQTGNFKITTKFGSFVTDVNNSVSGFSFIGSFVVGALNVSSLNIMPNNQSLWAEYTFGFTIPDDLPASTLIEVIFPADFPTLSTLLACQLSGGVTSHKRCSVNSRTVEIELGTAYDNVTDIITLKLGPVHNFSSSGNSNDDFQIRFKYSGAPILAKTDLTLSLRKQI